MWHQNGSLQRARKGHGVTFFEGQFWVVGGQGDNPTEKCSMVNDVMTCENHDHFILESYAFCPELFIVPKDFCDS